MSDGGHGGGHVGGGHHGGGHHGHQGGDGAFVPGGRRRSIPTPLRALCCLLFGLAVAVGSVYVGALLHLHY